MAVSVTRTTMYLENPQSLLDERPCKHLGRNRRKDHHRMTREHCAWERRGKDPRGDRKYAPRCIDALVDEERKRDGAYAIDDDSKKTIGAPYETMKAYWHYPSRFPSPHKRPREETKKHDDV